MDRRYEAYCLADPYFYDHPALREDLAPSFPHTRRPAPAGWSAGVNGDWWHLLPEGHGLPEQGWKIHVSATPADAERVLDLVWDACTAARLPFKFLRSRGLVFLRNSKYAERGSSGKFVTVYPRDEAELERAVALLSHTLDGTQGPYILSDLRVGAGPVYVRYGGFTPRRMLTADGESVPAIAHPDGHLVPDQRGPAFAPPRWAPLPPFLAPHVQARGEVSLAGLPYRVERALHFSNGGGVYQGTDTRTGRAVVLKEARPHAGLLADGRDAVDRLEAEHTALERAAGSGAGPEVIDAFTLGEHRFLVLEYVPGRTLNKLFSERFPLVGRDPDPAAVRTYTAWALGIQEKVERAVAALHACGVVFNDLHLFNIMVRPDDTITLIDFEVAAFTENARGQTLASRAFQAPFGTSGPAVDRYALACLRLALFLPLTSLLSLDRRRAAAMARAIRSEFPDVPETFLDEAVATITGGAASTEPIAEPAQGPAISGSTAAPAASATAAGAIPAARTGWADWAARSGAAGDGAGEFDPDDALTRLDWPRLRASLAAGIVGVASPEREDRLYPGDVAQFAGPAAGLGLAHGAAGVLYALHATGAAVPGDHVAWLVKRAGQLPADAGVGLYDGALGIAYTLDLLGCPDAASGLVDQVLAERWQRLGPGLGDGLAGVGLGLLHFAARTGDAAPLGAALEAGRLAAELLAQSAERDREPGLDADQGPMTSPGRSGAGAGQPGAGTPGAAPGSRAAQGAARRRAGLLRGASGPALLFVRLYEHTGDADWLARAGAALRLDLACCARSERDGSLRVDEGWRALPYLGDGSAGIGLVLRRYLRHREDAGFAASLAAIERAAHSRFYAQAGLFNGRAGLVLTLAQGDAWERADGAASPAVATAVAAGAGSAPDESPAAGLGPWVRRRGGDDGVSDAPWAGQARRLAWHAVDHRGKLAFPGDQLHRLSTDLATGSAGVLLALGTALHEAPVELPGTGRSARGGGPGPRRGAGGAA